MSSFQDIDNKTILSNPANYDKLIPNIAVRPYSYASGSNTCKDCSKCDVPGSKDCPSYCKGTDSTIAIVIKNFLEFDAVYFMRGGPNTVLWNHPKNRDPKENKLNGDPNFDCTVYDEKIERECFAYKKPDFLCQKAGVNITYYFRLKPYSGTGEPDKITVYLDGNDPFESAVIWAAPYRALYNNRCAVGSSGGVAGATTRQINIRNIALGPYRQSGAEFTISTQTSNGAGWGAKVSYDATFVNGLSYGVNMTYTDNCGRVSKIVASNTKPLPKELENSIFLITDKTKPEDKSDVTFPTILSDQYTADGEVPKFVSDAGYAYTNNELAQCASNLAYIPSGQHYCRLWYYYKYQDPNSYCAWIRDSEMQAYCWAMDEWICVDEFCGKENSKITSGPTYVPDGDPSSNPNGTEAMDIAFSDPGASSYVRVQLSKDISGYTTFVQDVENYINSQIIKATSNSTVVGLNYITNGKFEQKFETGLSTKAYTAVSAVEPWIAVSGTPYGVAINDNTSVYGKGQYTASFLNAYDSNPKPGQSLGIKLAFPADPGPNGPLIPFTSVFEAIRNAYDAQPTPPGDETTLKLSYFVAPKPDGSPSNSFLTVVPIGSAPSVEVTPVVGTYIKEALSQDAPTVIRSQLKEILPFSKFALLESVSITTTPPITGSYKFTPNIPVDSQTTSKQNSRSTILGLVKNAVAKVDPLIIFKTAWNDDSSSSTLEVTPIDTSAQSFLANLRNPDSAISKGLDAMIKEKDPTATFYGLTPGNGEENRYSCGYTLYQPTPDQETLWWAGQNQNGAVDNTVTVNGNIEGRNPAPLRYGGTFEIEFTELEVLKAHKNGGGMKPDSGNKPATGTSNDSNRTRNIILIVVGSVLGLISLVIIGIILFVIVRNKSAL